MQLRALQRSTHVRSWNILPCRTSFPKHISIESRNPCPTARHRPRASARKAYARNCLYTEPRAMAQSGIAHFFREAKLYPGADPRSYRIACRLLHHEKKSVLESRLSGGPSDQSRAARQSATAPRAPPRTTSRPSRPRCTASGRGPGGKRFTHPVPVKRVAVTRA